jgi:quercetin dioxygenase-like cupin family protein
VPGREVVLGTAELAPGAEVPWHTHYGDEADRVLEGDPILENKGQPDRMLRTGDHFCNPRSIAYSLSAAPGTSGGGLLYKPTVQRAPLSGELTSRIS